MKVAILWTLLLVVLNLLSGRQCQHWVVPRSAYNRLENSTQPANRLHGYVVSSYPLPSVVLNELKNKKRKQQIVS